MSLVRLVGFCACVAVFAVGCRTPTPRSAIASSCATCPPRQQLATSPAPPAVSQEPPIVVLQQQAAGGVCPIPTNLPATAVAPASFQKTDAPPGIPPQALPACPDQIELSLAEFVAEVQARNPSLQAMIAAWRAAAERYPQVVALEDPMFNSTLAPASFDSDQVEGAYALELGQKLPWFGKRAARGRAANAEARSASADVADTRLQLIETTELAFFDYYLVTRRLELNRTNSDVMRQFRSTAENRYRANQVTQQDILQADLELAQLERRDLELQRMHSISVARINTLLHQPPSFPLPPPPRQLSAESGMPDPDQLQAMALQQRPELMALGNQISARQAELDLAYKQYYPDAEIYGRYDTFWQPASTQGDLRGQVGARLNVPMYCGRLNAAVREANDRVSQKRAEYQQQVLDIQYEVQKAYAELLESEKAVQLYNERLVPIGDQNVSAARSNYDAGKTSFLDLATAERQLIEVRVGQQETLALYHQRLASLRRAIAGPIPSVMPAVEQIPVPAPR
jgi:outer membrane protein, heavy metal efflux system